jgi:Uma2 family endonuclease
MPPESPKNFHSALFVLTQLLKFVPVSKLSNKTEILVSGACATTLIPDLMMFTDELLEELQNATRATIALDMPPPVLVVEVVSPGKANEERDYRYKPFEYAARGIAGTGVDPEKTQVMVLTLVDGLYEEVVFKGCDRIRSQVRQELELTTEQV